ncbi:MAG: alpha/beta hydrolase [Acidimicrobiia bacterium]|nr:alpha/beta hydrolase [Acidimicrobiia bacterium]
MEVSPERIRIEPATGPALEARWDRPAAAAGAVVFCHPHPQHGGTMTAPLMHKVTKGLVEGGLAVLRFNFRGVGLSDGSWDGGIGEIDDVAAAVARAGDDEPALPLGLAGWSFGAVTGLAWQARTGDATPYGGIAPPVRTEYAERLPTPGDLAPARRLFILGDRDQFATVDELGDYAAAAGGSLEVLAGSDHFFYFREERVAALLIEHFLA